MAGSFELPPSRVADLGGPVHYVEWEGPPERTFVLVHGHGGAHLNWVLVGAGLTKHDRVLPLVLAGLGLHLERPLEGTVGDAMIREPRTIRAGALASEALRMMESRKITSLPVVEADGALAGVIQIHDLWRTELF